MIILLRKIMGIYTERNTQSISLMGVETGAGIRIEDASVKTGENKIPVKVTGAGFAGFCFEVSMPEGMTLKGMEKGEVLEQGEFVVNENCCSYYSSENVGKDGILFYLNVNVDETFQGGKIDINLRNHLPSNLSDSSGMNVPVEFIMGNISANRTVIQSKPKMQKILVNKKFEKPIVITTLKNKKAVYHLQTKAKGILTYKVTKGSSKYITVSKKGVVTLKKGCKKGTYQVTITAAATKNGQYKKAGKVITFVVK